MALVYKSEVAIFERVWATNFLAKAAQNGIGPFLKTIITVLGNFLGKLGTF